MSPLSKDAMLKGMADALPTHEKGDDSSDLASSYEVIALLVHAYLAALGFELCGLDEGKNLPEAESLAPRLPPQWNHHFKSINFVYKHKQSSSNLVIHIGQMGGKVEVRGLKAGDDEIYRFEKAVREVVQSSGLPVRIILTNDGESREDLPEKLGKVFVSDEALNGVLHDLKVNIVQKLIPDLKSEGYVKEAAPRAFGEARLPPELDDPLRATGPGPVLPHPAPPQATPSGEFRPPDFEDEHGVFRPPGGGLRMPGRSPFNIGHDDLHPPGLGPHDPLRGSFTPGGLPQPGGSSGMYPTFDDPLFQGQGGGYPGGPGQGYNPQGPPGARWDDVGPGGAPRFRGPGGSHGNNPFGGGGFGPGGGGII